MNKKIVPIIIICLVVAVLSFWGGMTYAGKNITAANASRQGAFGQNGGRNMMRGGAGGGFVSGTVLAKDATSLTIALRAPGGPNSSQGGATSTGGSKIVLISPGTQVEKTVSGAITDVAVGSQVSITGTANPDGSVSATSIQIRPTPPANGSPSTN
jgi:hypothetical protein